MAADVDQKSLRSPASASKRTKSTSPSPPSLSPPLSPSLSSSSTAFQQRPQHNHAHLHLKSQIPAVPTRLLVPRSKSECVLQPRRPASPAGGRHGRGVLTNGRLGRARAESALPDGLPIPLPRRTEQRWIDSSCRFEVVEEEIRLFGYQIYAVEKWIVERTRAITLLTVHTGDPKDKIIVTALSPCATLSQQEKISEWERVIHDLRRDGARPRETEQGIIMVTSLANFRSDFTVVHVPDGDFLAHREQLYANINLLRMGCSGRSALTLQEPSDTTKERFLATYQFRDTARAQDQFISTVLEFVRIFQSALSLFEFFPVEYEEVNGLLCDVTVDGIRQWLIEIGEPYLKIEPTERIADPSVISALLNLILTVRNKLVAIGLSQGVPKDPFLHPRRFTRALGLFASQRLAQSSEPGSLVSLVNTTAASGPPQPVLHHVYLNLPLIQHIDAAYEKYRSSESYKVHRVLLSKLDDLTNATTTAMSSSAGLKDRDWDPRSNLNGPTFSSDGSSPDLGTFVRKVTLLRGKEGANSLRYLWTGRIDQLDRKRQEGLWSDIEKEREEEKDVNTRSDSDDDGEGVAALPWSGRVQRKIETWTGMRSKKPSIDLTASLKEKNALANVNTNANEQKQQLPAVVISRDPDEPFSPSSGQASPISGSASLIALGNFSSAHGSSAAVDDAEYFKRLQQFNQMRPPPRRGSVSRRPAVASWSDPVSAEDLLGVALQEVNDQEEDGLTTSQGGQLLQPGESNGTILRRASLVDDENPRHRVKHAVPFRLRRAFSFDDRQYVRAEDCLSVSRMQVDVELCIQYLVMFRRETQVSAMISTLKALLAATSETNDTLRKYNESFAERIAELAGNSQIVADIEEAVSTADAATFDTDALNYEARSFSIPALWRMAQGPRQRVFGIRERVFGTRRRHSPETYGRFNRVQHKIDGSERLVDWMGRTEEDVQEEGDLPEIIQNEGEEDEESEDGDFGPVVRPVHARVGEDDETKTTSAWLLELFTKWGRVLGVGGAAVPAGAKGAAIEAGSPEEKQNHSLSSDAIGRTSTDAATDSGTPPPSPFQKSPEAETQITSEKTTAAPSSTSASTSPPSSETERERGRRGLGLSRIVEEHFEEEDNAGHVTDEERRHEVNSNEDTADDHWHLRMPGADSDDSLQSFQDAKSFQSQNQSLSQSQEMRVHDIHATDHAVPEAQTTRSSLSPSGTESTS